MKKKQKIVCLHCNQNLSSVKTESHRCIYELLDFLANEIAELKENECKNSGLNWRDDYWYLVQKITPHP